MHQPLRRTTPDRDEPKYKLKITGRSYSTGHQESIKLSTAQVQFWEDYVQDWVERTGRPVRRVDLLVNSYNSPRHVRRLDTEGHGPLFEQAMEVVTN
jgi:hypothetical protein